MTILLCSCNSTRQLKIDVFTFSKSFESRCSLWMVSYERGVPVICTLRGSPKLFLYNCARFAISYLNLWWRLDIGIVPFAQSCRDDTLGLISLRSRSGL